MLATTQISFSYRSIYFFLIEQQIKCRLPSKTTHDTLIHFTGWGMEGADGFSTHICAVDQCRKFIHENVQSLRHSIRIKQQKVHLRRWQRIIFRNYSNFGTILLLHLKWKTPSIWINFSCVIIWLEKEKLLESHVKQCDNIMIILN